MVWTSVSKLISHRHLPPHAKIPRAPPRAPFPLTRQLPICNRPGPVAPTLARRALGSPRLARRAHTTPARRRSLMSRFYCGECSSAPRRAFVILALQLLGSILYSHNGFASAPHACDASAIARGHFSTFLRGARFCITVSMPRDIRHISRTIVSSTLSRRWVPHLVWDPAGRDGARRSHLVNRIVACKTEVR